MTERPTLRAIDSVPVSDNVVEMLEEVLASAKAGNVSIVAIATVERDGSAKRAWSFCHNTATIVGAVEMMKRDIIEGQRCEVCNG